MDYDLEPELELEKQVRSNIQGAAMECIGESQVKLDLDETEARKMVEEMEEERLQCKKVRAEMEWRELYPKVNSLILASIWTSIDR
jgi:hypothetical protein